MKLHFGLFLSVCSVRCANVFVRKYVFYTTDLQPIKVIQTLTRRI